MLPDTYADLYSNVSKPMLDISIYARKLSQTIGGWQVRTLLALLVQKYLLYWYESTNTDAIGGWQAPACMLAYLATCMLAYLALPVQKYKY